MKGDGDKEENAYNVQEREREREREGRIEILSLLFFVSLSSGKKESRKSEISSQSNAY